MAFDTFPCNPYPISKGMLEKGNNDELNTRVTALEGEVSDLNDTKANQITIAPFFDPEAPYEVGDLVYYNGLSYRCTNEHEGEWDADDFAATTVSGELATLKSGLTGVSSNVTTVSGVTFSTNIIHKISKIATINLITDSAENTISCQPWESVTIGTIPEGFRPEYLIRLTTKISTGTAWIDVIFSISTNGDIELNDAISGEGFTLRTMCISTAYLC